LPRAAATLSRTPIPLVTAVRRRLGGTATERARNEHAEGAAIRHRANRSRSHRRWSVKPAHHVAKAYGVSRVHARRQRSAPEC
jgi:hypothetical protein